MPTRQNIFRPLRRNALLLVAVFIFASVAVVRAETLSIECHDVPSKILTHSVSTCVALPADYATSSRRYPVLFYLHGLFEDEHRWSERGGQAILEDLMTRKEVGDFIVVLPNGGKTFYVNSYDGHERYEDFFIQELVPWVDKNYRTFATRTERGIAGTSMGGYGALHLGMEHPDIFGSASAQSAALLPKFPNPIPTEGRWGFYARVLEQSFGDPLSEAYWDVNNPLTLAEHPEKFAGLKLYFDCGDQDRYGFEVGAKLLDNILTSKGFPHEYFLRSGGHGWTYLGDYMKYALEFHWKVFADGEKTAAARAGGQ